MRTPAQKPKKSGYDFCESEMKLYFHDLLCLDHISTRRQAVSWVRPSSVAHAFLHNYPSRQVIAPETQAETSHIRKLHRSFIDIILGISRMLFACHVASLGFLLGLKWTQAEFGEFGNQQGSGNELERGF